MDDILTQHDLLMLPCAPFRQLRANADHTQTRPKLLRYTAPISLSGTPTITIPHPGGAGMQLTAPRGQDAALLAYAATLILPDLNPLDLATIHPQRRSSHPLRRRRDHEAESIQQSLPVPHSG